MLGGEGADFLRGVAFWSIRNSFLGRWFCVTGAALRMTSGITFSWQAQHFRQVECTNRKRNWYEAVSSALNFPFLKEVSQNFFVFDVGNFKFRNSRRIVSFSMLPSSKTEDVSQNSCVFKLADRHIDRHYTTLINTTLITLITPITLITLH